MLSPMFSELDILRLEMLFDLHLEAMMTRRAIWAGVLLVLFFTGTAFAEREVNKMQGYMHDVDGQRVLHVWGTHYEMGYAQGYMLGPEITQIMREYVLELLPPIIYMAGHVVIPYLFELPDEYMEEAQGMIDGIFNSSADTFLPALGRNIDVNDLIFSNAVGDIGAMACSAQLAWGPGTALDPELDGETALVRNLDWALAGPNRYLLSEKTLVIVYTPTIPGQNSVAAVTFPGFMGCLTCMNEEGVAVAMNIAHNGIPLWDINFSEQFTHTEIILRQALHQPDIDGFDESTIWDMVANVQNSTRAGAVVLNLAEPVGRSAQGPAVILEADNAATALRTPEDEPDIPQNVLISANDVRKLRDFKPCDRYATMRELVQESNGQLTLDRMWEIEGEVIQDYFLSTTAQTAYFIPHLREIGVAFTDADGFSPDKEPAVLTWEELMELPEDVELPIDDDDDADDEDDNSCCKSEESDDDEDLCGCW